MDWFHGGVRGIHMEFTWNSWNEFRPAVLPDEGTGKFLSASVGFQGSHLVESQVAQSKGLVTRNGCKRNFGGLLEHRNH